MNKRVLCVLLFALICVSLFAEHVIGEGSYQGKHWQIWYYSRNDCRFVVDGKTILSGYYFIQNIVFEDKVYFEATKSEKGLSKLYTINGNLAISSEYSFFTENRYEEGPKRVIEFTIRKDDKWEHELYDADLQLIMPKYRYFGPLKDDDGNIVKWLFVCMNDFQCLLANDWKTWIGPSPTEVQRFGKVEKLSDSYYKCKIGSGWGLYSSNLKEIVAPDFEDFALFEGTNFVKFKLNGFWGVMALQNGTARTIIPTTRGYTSIERYIKSLKHFTYSMYGYKGECDINGRQISKIKVETPKQETSIASSSSSASSSRSSSSNHSENKSTTVVVEHQHTPQPMTEWVSCGACGHNPGVCQTCLGMGESASGRRCISCHGTGKCHFCNGQGGRYQTVYR